MPITVAIIQARMGSSRLPGKVLMDINGKPMIHHVIERTLKAIPEVILATTNLPEDDVLAEACKDKGVRIYRGHPTDVLERYIHAAQLVEADKIIRVTGDCAMIEPQVIKHVETALTEEFDYASNLMPRSYPKGLDCEALWFDVLLRLRRLSKPEDREHVTQFIRRNPDRFNIVNVSENRAAFNLSVDTQEDLDRVRELMK